MYVETTENPKIGWVRHHKPYTFFLANISLEIAKSWDIAGKNMTGDFRSVGWKFWAEEKGLFGKGQSPPSVSAHPKSTDCEPKHTEKPKYPRVKITKSMQSGGGPLITYMRVTT